MSAHDAQVAVWVSGALALEDVALEFIAFDDPHDRRMMALYQHEADRRWVSAIAALLAWSRS